jgi:hypothetical protein
MGFWWPSAAARPWASGDADAPEWVTYSITKPIMYFTGCWLSGLLKLCKRNLPFQPKLLNRVIASQFAELNSILATILVPNRNGGHLRT